MEIDPQTSEHLKELDAERQASVKRWRKARNDAIIERRRNKFEDVTKTLSPKVARFCHLVSLGLTQADAYMQAGFKSEGKMAAELACRLLKRPDVAKYYAALREAAFLANVLSLAEKRSYLADVARTPIGKVELDNKLASAARWHNGELVEVRMPDKIKAIELDAKLAGELHDNGVAINVGLQLVNQRLEKIDLPKDSLPA
jgi:hypothetical protein